jgi:hypothetical protein
MAEALILEFAGVGRDGYEAVNRALGLDVDDGSGEWPDGLVFHGAGATADGWTVFEIWESQAAQEQFMNERLGRALEEGGIEAPPSRAEWLGAVSHISP